MNLFLIFNGLRRWVTALFGLEREDIIFKVVGHIIDFLIFSLGQKHERKQPKKRQEHGEQQESPLLGHILKK